MVLLVLGKNENENRAPIIDEPEPKLMNHRLIIIAFYDKNKWLVSKGWLNCQLSCHCHSFMVLVGSDCWCWCRILICYWVEFTFTDVWVCAKSANIRFRFRTLSSHPLTLAWTQKTVWVDKTHFKIYIIRQGAVFLRKSFGPKPCRICLLPFFYPLSLNPSLIWRQLRKGSWNWVVTLRPAMPVPVVTPVL